MEFGDDADSELQEFILATVAQHQRRKNAQQVKNRMMARSSNGYWCFQAPVGYRYEKVQGHGKLLVRHEPYATILQEALEGYASGRFETQAEVQRFIMSRPEWSSATNSKVHSQAIYDILTRVLYAGYIDIPDWGLSLIPGKHEPIISFATYQRVQERLTGKAKVPARQNLKEDFALRGYVVCGECEKPFQGVLSKGRTKHYPYYLCLTKGCAHYGKSIRRDVMEDEFEKLLLDLQPSQTLFAMAREAFCEIWNLRLRFTAGERDAVEAELAKAERGVAQLLDRVVEADSDALVKAYEGKIRALEERKVELRERLASMGKLRKDFQTTFRTAMEFLANPYRVWALGEIAYRRLVLKTAFAERIAYVRGKGFRTFQISLPFRLLERSVAGIKEMVDATGIEPVTPSV